MRLWDAVIPLLPQHLRYVRYDLRGHGLSDTPEGRYRLHDLTDDAAALLTTITDQSAIVAGVSLGGVLGQALACGYPNQVRALVMSNCAAKMASTAFWESRMAAIEADGMGAVVDGVLDRWFTPSFRDSPDGAPWRTMLMRTPRTGYVSCCAALAEADLRPSVTMIAMPVLAIASEDDRACPPDDVRTTARLIPGAQFRVLPGVGHLPPVEAPNAFAAVLAPFLEEIAGD